MPVKQHCYVWERNQQLIADNVTQTKQNKTKCKNNNDNKKVCWVDGIYCLKPHTDLTWKWRPLRTLLVFYNFKNAKDIRKTYISMYLWPQVSLGTINAVTKLLIKCFPRLWPRRSYVTYFNSLWPSDAIWHQGSRSTLVQVMACCLTVTSHYPNQRWLIISKDQWCSSEGNFAWDITAISY